MSKVNTSTAIKVYFWISESIALTSEKCVTDAGDAQMSSCLPLPTDVPHSILWPRSLSREFTLPLATSHHMVEPSTQPKAGR